MKASRRRVLGAALAAAAMAVAAPAAHAVVPLVAGYDARIVGTVSEWNSFIPGYQVTGNVDLRALLFVEQRVSGPRADSPVIGLFTGETPALDNRPGAINFATNSQGFHVMPDVLAPTTAQIDVATVQANVAAGTVTATVDELSARGLTIELFRTQSTLISAPAQILAGTLALQFSADGRTVTGRFDLGGNGLIEPGNTLLRVRRYTATVTGTANTAVTLPSGAGAGGGQQDTGGGTRGGDGGARPALRRVRAPRGGLAGARRRGVAVALSCAAACSARGTLVVSKRLARRVGLRRRVVGAARARRGKAGRLAFHVRVARAARLRLAHLRRVKLTARVSVKSGGAVTRFHRALTLHGGR